MSVDKIYTSLNHLAGTIDFLEQEIVRQEQEFHHQAQEVARQQLDLARQSQDYARAERELARKSAEFDQAVKEAVKAALAARPPAPVSAQIDLFSDWNPNKAANLNKAENLAKRLDNAIGSVQSLLKQVEV